MTGFPNISDYSPQKVNNVVKQEKTKQQQQKPARQKQHDEKQENDHAEDENKKSDGLLDIYV
ncbi:hypothetical protein [Grimontia sp. NTOU-MAR1]|uniref:hypothetical protein n=1 Tax=Grimontia sp. NTOU-MAR1 TaxID=3111011 RepID=UPI002DB6E1C2|nr:hypothetical protein [Grimontia sp. NTOU-MAR1]WRV97688.1 hypothetical protein VP504_16885 [Grimontia sp. NTOU-MAR1]